MKTITLLAAVAACVATQSAFAAPLAAQPAEARDNARPVLLAEAGRPNRSAVGGAVHEDPTHGPGDRRAREAAARGPGELRRFIERTQGIYALRYEDYLKP